MVVALLVQAKAPANRKTTFEQPHKTVAPYVNPKEAATSRQRILGDAARQGYLVGGAHISFPGPGHVRAEKTGYSWAPVPYSIILQTPSEAAKK